MAKIKPIYSCTECGATSPKWQGQCPGCNQWNTLVETVAEKASSNHRFESLAPSAKLQNLSEIEARETERIATGIGAPTPDDVGPAARVAASTDAAIGMPAQASA